VVSQKSVASSDSFVLCLWSSSKYFIFPSDPKEVAVGAVAVEEVAVVAEVPSSFPSSSSDYLLYVALDII